MEQNYTCQDCRRFQSGECLEEDEAGEVCESFELLEVDNDNKQRTV